MEGPSLKDGLSLFITPIRLDQRVAANAHHSAMDQQEEAQGTGQSGRRFRPGEGKGTRRLMEFDVADRLKRERRKA